MSKTLPIIVTTLALALCGLCAVQWQREAGLRRQATAFAQELHTRQQKINGLEDRLKQWDAEISRLDTRVKELQELGQTNKTAYASTQRALHKAENDAALARKQVEQLEEAVEHQNVNLKKQNESIAQQNAAIKQQNDMLKKLGEERNQVVEQLNTRTRDYNGVVEKFNARTREYEALVDKYNALVKQVDPASGKAGASER
jgi:chromosome segregation ATPase